MRPSIGGLTTNKAINLEAATSWTPAAGTLNGSTTWPDGARIRVTSHLNLPAGATLTIGAGAIVLLNPGVNITNNGSIVINGTVDRPVVFMPQSRAQPWGGFFMRTSTGMHQCHRHHLHRQRRGPEWRRGPSFRAMPVSLRQLAARDAHGFRRHLPRRSAGARLQRRHLQLHPLPDAARHHGRRIHRGELHGERQRVHRMPGRHRRISSMATTTGSTWSAARTASPTRSSAGRRTTASTRAVTASRGCITSSAGSRRPFTRATPSPASRTPARIGRSISIAARASRTATAPAAAGRPGAWTPASSPSASLASGMATITPASATAIPASWPRRTAFSFTTIATCSATTGVPRGWTNAGGQMFIRENFLTVADTNFPNNAVWNPASDAWRLGAFGARGRVGLGFATRPAEVSIDRFPDGLPVGLSSFCTNEVVVDYSDRGDGWHVASTARCASRPASCGNSIPLPAFSGVLRVALSNPQNADFTGTSQLLFQILPVANTPLVAKGAGLELPGRRHEPVHGLARAGFRRLDLAQRPRLVRLRRRAGRHHLAPDHRSAEPADVLLSDPVLARRTLRTSARCSSTSDGTTAWSRI